MPRPVESEKLLRIIEAGRYAPTACNAQTNRFIVVSEKYQKLRALVLEQLAKKANAILQDSSDPVRHSWANEWLDIFRAFQTSPETADTVFYNAPCLLVVVSPDIRDGGIAAAYMEIMAAAEGLGALYNGIISGAINENDEARSLLGIQDHESAIICMLFGYSAVEYRRTVPRNKAKWELQ